MLTNNDRPKGLTLKDLAPLSESAETTPTQPLTPGAEASVDAAKVLAPEKLGAASVFPFSSVGNEKNAAIQGAQVSIDRRTAKLKSYRARNKRFRDRHKLRRRAEEAERYRNSTYHQDVWNRRRLRMDARKELFRQRLKDRQEKERQSQINRYLAQKMREILKRVLRQAKGRKALSTEIALGFTMREFRERVESQFRDGMSWANLGDVWQLDHIKEVATFLAEGVTDPAIINSLNNLQPLLIDEHRRKTAAFLARRAA